MQNHLSLVSSSNSSASSELITFLSSANGDYIADLYARYVQDPSSVDESWQIFFGALNDDARSVLADLQGASWQEKNHLRTGTARVVGAPDPNAAPAKKSDKPAAAAAAPAAAPAAAIDDLAAAWRTYGHFAATLDPLGIVQPKGHSSLKPHGLQKVYGGTTAYEFMHVANIDERNWLQQKIEGAPVAFSATDKKKMLTDITKAEGLEKFLATKFVGVKRFGLEGSESTMAAVEQVLWRGVELGVREVCFGMAHRGRLNMLTNGCGKSFTKLLAEFQGAAANPPGVPGSSDVKYHMGYSNDREINGQKVHVTLSPNPSHLEFVDAVVEGKTRAKQFQRSGKTLPYKAETFKEVLPVLLHGDAAFAGQGIVPEVLMMSQLKGYFTGGTIHIITNNQIGFTTDPHQARSGPYSSDVAKMIDAPIIHVNGDDVVAVVRAARLCIEYRQEFGKDIVLDIIGYRRNGHNETLEPMFTQPAMYNVIQKTPTTRERFVQQLSDEGTLPAAEGNQINDDFWRTLEEALAATSSYKANKADWLEGAWSGLGVADTQDARRGSTAVSLDILKEVGNKLGTPPENFNLNSKIARQLQAKQEMMKTGENIDWGTAEGLAMGTLLTEGFPVRITGQDVETGTFSHRHAVLSDQVTNAKYVPLNNMKPDQKAMLEVHNSPLSEAAVLGFEYGFSAAEPNTLTIWEAQFGDFVNGAQVLIDQFIASAEAKWLRMCGLVMLLPHGFEGQGPEHSSARLERFLQLCAEDNMQVANITTPANFYHALRRQIHRNFRKPLVVMSPKSLLRHKLCVSKLADFGPGSSFHRVIGETSTTLVKDSAIKRVVLCSGKVYYDLWQAREDQNVKDVALVRVEQLYPFPHDAVKAELMKYPSAEVVWCQEEPQNQGSWTFVDRLIEGVLTELKHKAGRPRYVGRPAAAAPACGQASRHNTEQTALVDEALG